MICSKCLNDHKHAFPIYFNNGVCTGCSTHFEKACLGTEVDVLIDQILGKKSKSGYDCIVPVFGDSEDYHLIRFLVERRINPLVVWVNSYYGSESSFYNLQNLITNFDLDSQFLNPNFEIYKKLVVESLRKCGNILLPYHYLFHSFATNVAIEKKIPSIIFPQMQAIEQTGVFSYSDKVRGNWWSKSQFDFSSKLPEELVDTSSDLNLQDVDEYIYPSDESVFHKGIKIHYLSNYISWDPFLYWDKAIYDGFMPVDNIRTFENHYRAGCTVYYQMHDLLRFRNFGYIKARDHFNREIRFGRITRKDAINKYLYYLGKSFDNSGLYDALSIGDSGRRWYENNVLSDVYRRIESELKNFYFDEADWPKSEIFKYCRSDYKTAGKQVIYSKSLFI